MKAGVSLYSLSKAIEKGEMDVLQAIQWIADNGGEHVEIVPWNFSLAGNDALIKGIVRKSAETGLEISSYTIGGNFITADRAAFEKEVERLKGEVDIAHALGVKLMRHDVAWRQPAEATLDAFDKDLPLLAEGCGAVADHARKYGITTSVENHGFHVQGSERVRRLLKAVGRGNFKTTLDIGNFLCVDEDPVCATKSNIAYASMVHLKDFYRRPASLNPGEGWFQSSGGSYLRGAIFGHGDIDAHGALKAICDSGYDGYLSLEFEGLEDCRTGAKIGLDNVRRMLKELKG